MPLEEDDQGSELFEDFGKDNIEIEESLNSPPQGRISGQTGESVFDRSGIRPPSGTF